MKSAPDSLSRDKQASFHRECSCTYQIATLRIIIEQSLEWNSGLFLAFIDFEKAFHSVDREATGKSYGITENQGRSLILSNAYTAVLSVR